MVERFLTAYPQWESYLGMVTDNYDRCFLNIKIPAPVNPTERDLIIASNGSSLVVHFDWHHTHFYGSERYLDEGDIRNEVVIEQLRQGWKIRKLTNQDYTIRLAPPSKSWIIFQSENLIFNDIKMFINSILAEQVVVFIRMAKDQWLSSGWCQPAMLPAVLSSLTTKYPGWTGYTRSWLGTYNKTYNSAQAD
ncbi:MAG: hypothetical protein ABI947_06580 [Chloroflexota bacterium]